MTPIVIQGVKLHPFLHNIKLSILLCHLDQTHASSETYQTFDEFYNLEGDSMRSLTRTNKTFLFHEKFDD